MYAYFMLILLVIDVRYKCYLICDGCVWVSQRRAHVLCVCKRFQVWCYCFGANWVMWQLVAGVINRVSFLSVAFDMELETERRRCLLLPTSSIYDLSLMHSIPLNSFWLITSSKHRFFFRILCHLINQLIERLFYN